MTIARGDRVRVREQGLSDWYGIVKTVKNGRRETFYEIERDDTDHECWIIGAPDVELAMDHAVADPDEPHRNRVREDIG